MIRYSYNQIHLINKYSRIGYNPINSMFDTRRYGL